MSYTNNTMFETNHGGTHVMKKFELTDRQVQVLLDALEYYTGDMEAEDEEDDVYVCDQLVDMLRGVRA